MQIIYTFINTKITYTHNDIHTHMQVLLLQPPAPEGTGTLFELSVNGKRFFGKGANVIPLSTFEAAINRTLVNELTTYMYYNVNSIHIHR